MQVFVGPPFPTVPLAAHVDYPGMAIFLDIEESEPWIDRGSTRWEFNHMVSQVRGGFGSCSVCRGVWVRAVAVGGWLRGSGQGSSREREASCGNGRAGTRAGLPAY